MNEIVQDLERIRSQFLSDLDALQTSKELEDLRIAYLGKKGMLTSVLKGMGKLSKEERPAVGKLANEVRELLNDRLDEVKQRLLDQELEKQLQSEVIDVTIPGIRPPRGAAHPIEQTIDLICRVFVGMGYTIAEGPEVELVANNFDRLNIPASHPSRDEGDTFILLIKYVCGRRPNLFRFECLKNKNRRFVLFVPAKFIDRIHRMQPTHLSFIRSKA